MWGGATGREAWGGISCSPICSPNVINIGRRVWGWAIDDDRSNEGMGNI